MEVIYSCVCLMISFDCEAHCGLKIDSLAAMILKCLYHAPSNIFLDTLVL